MPKGIHTRGTPIGVHTVDFLIWIPDRSRFGDRSYNIKSLKTDNQNVFHISPREGVYNNTPVYWLPG